MRTPRGNTQTPHTPSAGASVLRRVWPAVAALALVPVVVTLDGHGSALSAIVDELMVAPALLLCVLVTAGFASAFAPGPGPARITPVALSMGVACVLTLCLITNMVGEWFGVLIGAVMTWSVPIAGLALVFARRLLRGAPQDGSWGGARSEVAFGEALLMLVAVVLPTALLLAASLSPPGWLWESEFGGYDALSYHLQLPQEWLAAGRLWPLSHNVYSYLPSSLESAFLSLAKWTLAPQGSGAEYAGLLAGGGWRAIACQVLHALCAVGAAWGVAGLTRRLMLLRSDPSGEDAVRSNLLARLGGVCAAGVYLATPWSIVVGSLAYNEHAVNLLFAGALTVALDRTLSPVRKGVLSAVLIGAACGVKPTAMLFCTPPVAVALLATTPWRAWAQMIAPGVCVGIAMLAPWMIRNVLASGNPIFPYAHGVFGLSHWQSDQFERFAAGHHFGGSLADRVRLLVLPDYADPARPGTGVHRGMLHPQWLAFFPMVFVFGAVACVMGRPRNVRGEALVLAGGVVLQMVAWLFLTHIQSRFLMPTLVPGAVLTGAGMGVIGLRLAERTRRGANTARALGGNLTCVACAVLVGVQAAASLSLYLSQRDGRPALAQAAGLASMFRTDVSEAIPARADGSRPSLLLMGDATPFYVEGSPAYNTTWDRWPLLEAMRAAPGEPLAWTAALAAEGHEYALVHLAEIARLHRSGFCDPTLTPEAVAAWMQRATTPVQSWFNGAIVLVKVHPPPTTAPTASPPPPPPPAQPNTITPLSSPLSPTR